MGPDMMHLPYSCLCFCESFNSFRSKNEQVFSKKLFPFLLIPKTESSALKCHGLVGLTKF